MFNTHTILLKQSISSLSHSNQIIIKRVERIKLNKADNNDNGNDTMITQVEDKDRYYKQDKDDDKKVYVVMGIYGCSIFGANF